MSVWLIPSCCLGPWCMNLAGWSIWCSNPLICVWGLLVASVVVTHNLLATPRATTGGEHPEQGCTEGKSDADPHDGKSLFVQFSSNPEVLETFVKAFPEGGIESCSNN